MKGCPAISARASSPNIAKGCQDAVHEKRFLRDPLPLFRYILLDDHNRDLRLELIFLIQWYISRKLLLALLQVCVKGKKQPIPAVRSELR